MSGALDSIFAGSSGLVKSILNTFGTTATISYTNETAYNPATMSASASASVSYSVSCSPPSPFELSEVDGSTVIQGDVKFVLPESDTTERPPVGCQVLIGTDEFRAVRVDPIMSGDLVAAYRLQLRRIGVNIPT